MSRDRRRYISYLLRLWQTERGGALVWQASLESARTGERHGFASLEELFVFLKQETAPINEEDDPSVPREGEPDG